MYKYITKTLDWGVKIASVAVTGPATWIVATTLFKDVSNPTLLFIMRLAAVFLIEGVLLSNWLLLEFDKQATPQIKARYGIIALAMYAALLIIGVQHEGWVGIVFRVALFAALISSGWDTYVYTWQRANLRMDRDINNSWAIKLHSLRLSIQEAVLERTVDHVLRRAEQKSRQKVGLYTNILREELDTEKTRLFFLAMKPLLDDKFDVMIEKALELQSSDIEIATSYQRLPAKTGIRQLVAGSGSKSNPSSGIGTGIEEETKKEKRQRLSANQQRWLSVVDSLPTVFTWQDIMELSGCAKTQAFSTIKYAKDNNFIKPDAPGWYQRIVLVEEPERVETPPTADPQPTDPRYLESRGIPADQTGPLADDFSGPKDEF